MQLQEIEQSVYARSKKVRIIRIALGVLLFIATLFCGGMMFYLSSQNGEQTAATSEKITEWAINFLGKGPMSQDEFYLFHMQIRKMAHVVLYFGAGALGGLWVQFGKTHSIRLFLLSGVGIIVVIAGFLDEWLKQTIPGRHFNFSEAVLNMISGLKGLFLICLASIIIRGIIYFVKIKRK